MSLLRMTLRVLVRVVTVLVALSAAGLAFAYWYDSTGQRPDVAFDTRVGAPAYGRGTTDRPVVVFDVAHHEWHTPTGRYRPFVDLLRHDGYDVRENRQPFTPGVLDSARVFVVANALGPPGHEAQDAFTPDEDSTLTAWVRGGGSLLLVADHAPFGAAAASLARSFGVTMYLAFARDDAHSGWDNERLVFSAANGLLADHAITRGRDARERVAIVRTFTGQSLSVPPGATAILRMGEGSYDWESRKMRHAARGHAQAVAFPFGRGRVVVLGEAGVLSAQVDPLGFKMGMNAPGSDDRQFALNVMHWLSGLLP